MCLEFVGNTFTALIVGDFVFILHDDSGRNEMPARQAHSQDAEDDDLSECVCVSVRAPRVCTRAVSDGESVSKWY